MYIKKNHYLCISYLGMPKCTLSTCCLNIASTWVLKSH